MPVSRLARSIRRNELLVLASLLAGLAMALFEMTLTWAAGAGIWTFPGHVSAVAFRSLQTASARTFSVTEIAAGLAIHLAVALVMGLVFAALAPRLRESLGLDGLAETPSYSLVGLAIGLATFGVAWWGILPHANPIMVRALDPTFLAMAHAVWGLSLGVTRKAWVQTAPATRSRSSTASPQAAGAGSTHKAPAGPATREPSGGEGEEDAAGSSVATLQPEEDEDEADDEFQGWGDEIDDDLSPWPDPPDPTEDEADDGGEDGYATPEPRPDTDDEETGGLAMTEHARRSLEGLTDREPELPPVHQALNTTLTHVAPGRAVCTIDADERLHDATGAVQSGVLISLGELAATIAMETVAPESQHATVSSNVQVEGSVQEGHVVAEAEVTERVGTTTLTAVEVRDARGQVLVRATFQAATGDGD